MKRICGKGLLSLLAAIALLLWPLAGIAEGNDMTGVFDFENRKVRLNSGYDMPILGLGTYADAVGEGVRRGMEAYGIPREDIFVITKIYPNQFSDPEAAIDMALEKLDIGYIDMMLLHHPGAGDVNAYKAMEKYVEAGKIHSLGLSNWYVEELTEFLPQVTIMPALVQNEIHPYYQEQDVVPFIQEKGIVVKCCRYLKTYFPFPLPVTASIKPS